jgi:hypothetical protein
MAAQPVPPPVVPPAPIPPAAPIAPAPTNPWTRPPAPPHAAQPVALPPKKGGGWWKWLLLLLVVIVGAAAAYAFAYDKTVLLGTRDVVKKSLYHFVAQENGLGLLTFSSKQEFSSSGVEGESTLHVDADLAFNKTDGNQNILMNFDSISYTATMKNTANPDMMERMSADASLELRYVDKVAYIKLGELTVGGALAAVMPFDITSVRNQWINFGSGDAYLPPEAAEIASSSPEELTEKFDKAWDDAVTVISDKRSVGQRVVTLEIDTTEFDSEALESSSSIPEKLTVILTIDRNVNIEEIEMRGEATERLSPSESITQTIELWYENKMDTIVIQAPESSVTVEELMVMQQQQAGGAANPLTSLKEAQDRANAAKLMATMASLRPMNELWLDEHGTYASFCPRALEVMAQGEMSVTTPDEHGYILSDWRCFGNTSKYAISGVLRVQSSGRVIETFCVDSTGMAERNLTANETSLACK